MKKTFSIILLLLSFITYSQEKSVDLAYKDYFNLHREIPYLQLNKTSFLHGENIWLQAYILNQQTQKLHKHTTNLHVTIYNEKGEHKLSKLLYVKDGIATGNINIDSTFTDNVYYIKAKTKWMNNFYEDETFSQKIKIVNNSSSSSSASNSKDKYDLQILPEGGHLVESTNATIGIVFKDYKGKGVKIKSGSIINSNNRKVTEISTNQFGLGKVSFFYEPNTNYSVSIITQEGERITRKITKAKPLGLTLTISNPNSSYIKATINTNDKTLQNNFGKKYLVLVHNASSSIKSSFILKKEHKTYNLIYSTKKIPTGTNIITVFNSDGKPLLERVFFNYKKSLSTTIKYSFNRTKHDSINVRLTNNNKNLKYLSVSFLPNESKSYHLTNNMFSKFLLTPYIKGSVENSKYYFINTNRKKLTDLDLLLLNQGWSKYNWYNIFNAPPKKRFEFEKGITISGTINSKKLNDSTKLMLFSYESNLYIEAPIIKNKFTFKNIYLNDTSFINYTILGKEKISKPTIYNNFYPIITKTNIKPTISYNSNSTDFFKSNNNLKGFISNRILDEVEITAKSKKKNKNKPLRGIYGLFDSYRISDGNYPKTLNILSFLRTKGFNISGNYPFETIQNQRGPSSIITNQKPTSVFLDNQEIVSRYNNDLFMISNMNLEDFDEIIISKSFGGQIYLFSNNDAKTNRKGRILKRKTKIGFVSEKEYYQPKYFSTKSDIFKDYGAIYWKSNIKLKDKEVSFNFDSLHNKNIKMYLEGISENGSIIYQEIEIK